MNDVIAPDTSPRSLGDTPIGNAVQLRERMRALIHAEVEKINPTDDAQRALELIIESSLRPSYADGEVRLTVIDSSGHPRTLEKDGEQVPFTLQDLIAELRALHPVLFKSPHKPQAASSAERTAPEAPRASIPPKPALRRDWLTLEPGEPKLAGDPEPSLRGHALAHWRKGRARFHAWSRNLSDGLRSPAPLQGSTRIAGMRKGLAASAERAQAFFDRMQDDVQDKPVSRRPGFALGLVAAVLLLLGFGAFLLLRPGETTQASTEGPAETGALAPNEESSHAPPSAARAMGTHILRGVPDVIDTATLSLDGEVVRLFGVEWAPGAGKPDDLTSYLQGREVTCEPASGNDTYRCRVGGQDLSRVILYNGGGQPTGEATPELKAAADHAREAKLGVWSKQP